MVVVLTVSEEDLEEPLEIILVVPLVDEEVVGFWGY